MPATYDLTDVLYRLNDARIRATYGAVAGVTGGYAPYLMNGFPRDPLHSWVVNKVTHRPTHYTDEQTHLDLLQTSRVIDDADDLRAFLDAVS